MCSSTPIVVTPRTRSGLATKVLAADWIAFQHVIQATPRRRAIAETLVSSWRSESTAQSTARVLSLARGAAKAWSSVQVSRRQAASGQRQIRLAQRTRTGRPKDGVSCRTCTRRP